MALAFKNLREVAFGTMLAGAAAMPFSAAADNEGEIQLAAGPDIKTAYQNERAPSEARLENIFQAINAALEDNVLALEVDIGYVDRNSGITKEQIDQLFAQIKDYYKREHGIPVEAFIDFNSDDDASTVVHYWRVQASDGSYGALGSDSYLLSEIKTHEEEAVRSYRAHNALPVLENVQRNLQADL